MNRLGVSVIICCHNGASRLRETIHHLAAQQVDGIPWEFILVDNGSLDDSVAVATATWAKCNQPAPLRVVGETRLGLSNARARGFREASYEFMLMCDDDNWLAPDYLQTAYRIMIEKPFVAALGGLGKIVYETAPPKWIEYARMFAAGEQADRPGKVVRNRLYGAGCVIRKSSYEKLTAMGFKSLLEDRKGTNLSSGGDYELCYALAIMGYDIWYDDRLRFTHFITRERLTWEYFIRYARESSTCFDVLACYKMVACNLAAHKFSFMVMARDFLYCLRHFFRINLERAVTSGASAGGKVLYFRHIILRGKLIAYCRKYRQIVKNHGEIMRFKESCAQHAAASSEHGFAPKATFSLKLSRPLQ